MPTIKPKPQLNLNVSGNKGVGGSDGSYAYGSGSDGNDATEATPGEDAGDVRIELHANDTFGGANVSGQIVDPNGRRTKVDANVSPGGSINVQARGGSGGEGGDGGDGGDGVDGMDGSDATRYSRGDDGYDGGDAGDGGDATSGADAGDGGNVSVQVGEDDTDLLAMLDNVNVRGGEGGDHGRHGEGGDGGDGGDGGSSHSWTETEGSGEDARTTHHSNQGGYDGRDGRDGSDGRGRLQDGSDGQKGTFGIDVKGADGSTQTFDDRYRMHSENVNARSKNNDGIIEPGENVSVDVSVRNRGPMASPSGNSVLSILSNQIVQSNSASLRDLKPSLASGKSETVTGLEFQTTTNVGGPSEERLRMRGTIEPEVRVTRADRALLESAQPTSFEVTYPVEISPITGDRTATLTNPAEVRWSVKNISSKALGEDTDTKRMVESYLKRVGGDTPVDDLTFTGSDGKTRSLAEGIGRELKTLDAGQAVEIRGTIGFKKSAPAYSQVELRLGLNLDDVNNNDVAKTIQQRAFSVQLAKTYAQDPDAGLLVVVNNRSTKGEIAAWEQLASDLGTKANIWNLSLYGAVSLNDAVGDADLGKDFAGKTVVVLNNAFDGEARTTQASSDLGQAETLKATFASNMSTLFIGGQANLGARLDARGHSENVVAHDSVSGFLDAAVDGDGVAGASQTLGRDVVEVYARGTPSQADIESAAKTVADELIDEHPERRHQVTAKFQPGPKDDSLFSFFKKQRVGTLEVTRGIDVNRHSVAHLSRKDVHDPKFILSDQNRYALVKSMPFAQKLQALGGLDGKAPMAEIVRSAILSDIAEEQQLLREDVWDIGFSEKDATSRLRRLGEFTAFATSHMSAGEDLIALTANIKHMTSQATTIWDRVLPGRSGDTVSDASGAMIANMLKSVFPDKSMRKQAKGKIDTQQAALKTADDQELKNASDKNERAALKQADRNMMEYLRPESLWTDSLASDFAHR